MSPCHPYLPGHFLASMLAWDDDLRIQVNGKEEKIPHLGCEGGGVDDPQDGRQSSRTMLEEIEMKKKTKFCSLPLLLVPIYIVTLAQFLLCITDTQPLLTERPPCLAAWAYGLSQSESRFCNWSAFST